MAVTIRDYTTKILNQQLFTVEVWDSHHPGSYTHTRIDVTPVKTFINAQQKLINLYSKYSKGLTSGKLSVSQLVDLHKRIKVLRASLYSNK